MSLKGRVAQNVVLIPTEAVQRSPEGAGKIVLVIGADGTAKKRTVVTGIQAKESTEIVEGLKPGDMVITGGGYGLDDGTKVKIGPAEGKDADEPGGKKDGGDAKDEKP